MKHFKKILGLAAVALCCCFQQAFAQQMPPMPVDPNVRIGKLDNGLTYYIRHNDLPEHRVEFHIAQKVGSILEEPHQRGLAHFLEHMAFNGTKNFPGDERGPGIVQWCETKGIKFGVNLNAYTSIDETVYRISNVPSTDETVVDSCLLILHDWSNAVLLADEEIDKERGVIHEEWRSRNSGMLRLYTEAQPVLFPDSKYSDCMPIGSIDVIDNFPYQAIRDYYAKWYRPDLQGIIIVGDIDVNQMEQKVKTLFGEIPLPADRAERIYYPVPDNDRPIVYIGKDKEVDMPNVDIYFKHDPTPDSIKTSMGYLVQDYMLSAIATMLDERFSELQQKANPPFNESYCLPDGDYLITDAKKSFNIGAYCKETGLSEALKVLLTEVERVRRYGFTASEYDRARANILRQVESAYNERNNTKNDTYVNQCIAHFLDSEPMPGIETEYTFLNQVAPNIPVEIINQAVKELITSDNQAVFIAAPDKEGVPVPTVAEVMASLNNMRKLDVQPYEDKVSNEPLMKETPQGGQIVAEQEGGIYGTTELTLGNGIKVYLKKTDFKDDEIRMTAYSLGGTSLFDDADKLNFNQGILNGVVEAGGAGNFSNMDLTKLLAGKKVSVSAGVGTTQEYVHGNCSPKDLETMLQLTYLYVTQPRKDEDAFASFKTRLHAQLESGEANPISALNDTLRHTLYGNHPRFINLKADMVEQIDYDRVLALYRDRFADMGDFRFFFVGNIDIEAAKPLIAQYLGTLPTAGRTETFRDNHMDMPNGKIEKVFAKEQQTPTATTVMLYHGNCAYDLRSILLTDFLSQTLNMVYTEEIREKEGGTYGVSAMAGLSPYPKKELTLQIVYQTGPDKFEQLNKRIVELLNEMAANGPSEEKMQKAKEYMLKKYNDNQKENSYWLNNLKEYYYTGIDQTKDYTALVNGITAKDVQQFAADLLKQGNALSVVMTAPDAE